MEKLETQEDLKNLFLKYSEEMYRFAYVRLGWNKEPAEDVIQDLFMKAWDNRTRYNPEKGTLRTWLYAILRNLIIDKYRKSKTNKEVKEEIEELNLCEDRKDDDEILVWDSLDKLKKDEKELLILRYMQDLTNSDIARIKGKSENTIKVAIHRVIKKLKVIIENTNGGK